MEQELKEFWIIYDKYIQTEEVDLMPELSILLAKIEKHSRIDQLLRPENGWNEILAWQVLRNQQFIYPRGNFPFFLNAGEIIAWSPQWDRDVYLTRIPSIEEVSGYIIRPGYYLECDQKEMNDKEWVEFVKNHTFTDERGLYLPLYDFPTIIKLANSQIEKAKEQVIKYLKK